MYRLFVQHAAAFAQNAVLRGRVTDNKSNEALIGGTLILFSTSDTLNKKGAKTDNEGNFQFNALAKGNYILRVSYIGYNPKQLNVNINSDLKNIGNIKLEGIVLKEVLVEGMQQRVEQKGDTTQFNANAYKTNPDANAEDLITKMPGVTSENGQVKVHGENVQQVLVDGKPFFGDDPNMALKNLPAEVIDKIQVFDKVGDQQEFTGFKDGNTTKSINIVTKKDKNNGQFGKIYAGYGTENRYTAGGNINLFKGDRRVSIIGLSNNINQQNFSSDDLLGISGGGNSGRGRGGMRGMGGSGNWQGGGGSDFLIGSNTGINKTHSFGVNYSDNWGKKLKVTSSYFFNNSVNDNFTLLKRQYITSADSGFLYNENSNSASDNVNHRVSLRLEYTIDSSNSIVFTPRFNLTDNFSETALFGNSINSENAEISRTTSNYNATNFGYSLNNNLLFRHKFKKQGRTISLNVGHDIKDKTGDAFLVSNNWYNYFKDSTYIDQQTGNFSEGYSINSSIVYTEPLDSTSQLMFNYSPSYTYNFSDKQTRNYDPFFQSYNELDTALSNRYDNTYFTNSGGVSYRKNKGKINFMAGVNYQHAKLKGNQDYPSEAKVNETFSNILPQAMINYKFSKTKNLRLFYRTNTNAPSITQLQNVIDNNNPLLLRTGNPNLEQSFSNNLMTRYGATNTAKGTSFLFFVMGNITQDYIGNSTFLPSKDTVISGILLPRGGQLTRPENLQGYKSLRTFLTYGLPVKFLKSNLNLNTGFTYNHTPALINERINFANNYNFNQGIVLSSNISENVDFTLSYTANYSIVKNTIRKQSDNNYFSQNSSARINWIPYKGFVINTSLNHTSYSGLADDIDNDFLLWNASIGYRFLKDKSLEAKLSVYDILDENNSITRNVTETYIEDSESNVLNRYALFTLTYNLRKFGGTENQNPSK